MALKVAVIGCGGIGNTHGPIYLQASADRTARLLRHHSGARGQIGGARRRQEVVQHSGDAGGRRQGAGHGLGLLRRRGQRRRPLQADDGVPERRPARPVRKADQQQHRACPRDGRDGEGEGRLLSASISTTASRRPARKPKSGSTSGKLGTPLLMQHDHVDRQPERDLALVPYPRPASALASTSCATTAARRRKVQAFFNRAPREDGPDGKRVCWSNAQVNILFENGVVGHLTGSYDANPAHNLERCEVMGTEGRFVLENCFEELTFYPRRSHGADGHPQQHHGRHDGLRPDLRQAHRPLDGAGQRRRFPAKRSKPAARTAWPCRRSSRPRLNPGKTTPS